MKVSPITNTQIITQSQKSLLKRIRGYVSKQIADTRELIDDARTYLPHRNKYVIYGGKRVREVDLPSYVWGPNDYAGTTIRDVKFSSEDVEKMKRMTVDDRMAYKKKLLEENKYTLGDIIGQS